MKYTLFQDIDKELVFYGIYNTSVDMWDGKDVICLARKRFFETGTAQKKRSTVKTENGLYNYSYNIADGSNIRYKKSRGTQIAERSVDVSGGYCIETFDRFRSPFKRTYFNTDHSWRETEYYSPLDRSVNMNISPVYENGITYISLRTSSGTEKLVPFNSTLDKETTDKLNEIVGEPDIFCVTDCGSFYFCTEDEYAKRKKALEKLVYGKEIVSEKDDEINQSIIVDTDKLKNDSPVFDLRNSPDVFIDSETSDEEEKQEEMSEAAEQPETETSETAENSETETDEIAEQPETETSETAENSETETDEIAEQPETEINETAETVVVETEENAGNNEEEKEMAENIVEDIEELEDTADKAENTENMGAGASFDSEGKLLYAGGMVNGKQSGVGMTYNENDHTFFIGKYKDGEFLGTGTQLSFDGEIIYKGGFKDGCRDGFGIAYNNDNVVYKGMWSGGRYNGCGILFEDNAPRYAGVFENGCMNGRINEMSDNVVIRKSLYVSNELKYTCEFSKEGSLVYCGNMNGENRNGMGCCFTDSAEKQFEGIFRNGQPDRPMRIAYKELADIPECSELEGTEYALCRKAPEYAIEKMIEAGGETGIYTGKLKDGKPCGKGTILYPDYYYTGGFVDGKLYGEGTVYLNSGEEIKGVFSASPIPDGKTITLSDVLYYYKEF